MNQHSTRSSGELHPTSVPLIDLSRSPSPYPRSRSAVHSEDEDDEVEIVPPIQPLIAPDFGSSRQRWRDSLNEGGLGGWLLGSPLGWQVYPASISNCPSTSTGPSTTTDDYRFPYPLTATYLQLLLTHFLLVGFASLMRGLARPLHNLGLGAAVSPSHPVSTKTPGYRAEGKSRFPFVRWIDNGSGGIAGGGVFEFDRKVARQVLPLALIYIGKVVLSNISFAYATLEPYTLTHLIPSIPLTLALTAYLTNTSHSIPILSSTLATTLNLALASIRPARLTWESILAGLLSSIFTALYPIQLLRTYRALTSDHLPSGNDLIPTLYADDITPGDVSRTETRAFWRTLHYTSLLSLFLLTPLWLLSGEALTVYHNCYFLDVPFFWFLVFCGGVSSAAVFGSTLLLVSATSPLTTAFVGVPRAALQLVCLGNGKMAVRGWVGIALCWVCSGWFLWARRVEGRGGGGKRGRTRER
ncbi:hypothetical protein H2199_005967 [Coniosporium tulheliwenetii]|uniref:Uncharacterized protein n=1 Tax=Coniosporium tulheliwenetii TaxID=3383036 RepID=A0ACC2YYB6_9PEZI|nr:hypothetical protein H2199_005967 [Cladosporium sp. JES 115]